MAFWQVFTGIGFLFDSPTQAFFFNQVGTLLTVLTLYSGISYFTVKKPNLLPYPIIATTIFCSMPMVVFQQAKDMKLDLALFAVSIISVMLVFFALSSTRRSAMLRLMGLAGVLAGIAFSIKFTSIMIMIGTIGMFFYARLGLAGLLGFTSIFVGVFTRLHLWSLLNVNYPATSPWLNIFGYGMIALGIVLIGVGIYKSQEKKYVSIFLIPVLIYSLGIGVAIGPWIVKNLIESRTISVTGLLYGDIRVFSPDYTLVYTPEKLESIKNLGNVSQISDSGTTLNEDLGRYFGYESGINNYLKLPINLTTQKNQ